MENDVAIEHAGARLAGTVVAPGVGRFPTVLMLHGSGPMDRNEDMPGQRLSVFNTFAERLVRDGVASLRFDKRGCGASTGDFETAGVHDAVADAVAWIDWLGSADFCDPERLILLGHSEGCLTALSPDQALMWNVGTCRSDAKRRAQAEGLRKGASIDAEHRDGVARSSAEAGESRRSEGATSFGRSRFPSEWCGMPTRP
jgi:hypothetical protein